MFERKGFIKRYQVIPDFNKIGYPIYAISVITPYDPAAMDSTGIQLREAGEVLFLIGGAGGDVSFIALTIHKTYRDYVAFLTDLSEVAAMETTFMGLTESIVKTFEIGDLDIDLGKP